MPLHYFLSSIAERDITRVVEYIARDNLDAALNLVDRFTQAFELLSTIRSWESDPNIPTCIFVDLSSKSISLPIKSQRTESSWFE